MKSIFNQLGKIILILSILSTSILLIIQFLSYHNEYAIYSPKVNNKFIPFPNGESYQKGIIVLKNMNPSYEKIGILLNGESIGSFINDDEIKIYVHDNDLIEIDGTKYNKNLDIKVVAISNNIETPNLGNILTTFQSIEILGKVKLK
jgi:hypothetical protein